MDVVGSEIGQKMRSAIKAKLTELGCYVDDELPDYVMVMVANKRTRAQMDEDLQLFLGDNTELFVNWLHQVLKKLQEVQVTAPLKAVETEKVKERSKSKERKPKEKKEKEKIKKSDAGKKTKKREKEKAHKKKEDKKVHKEKKRSKRNESIRPNIPPMLMNMEKDSEPSITDVFAGQILKNHGITLDHKHDITQIDAILLKEKKPILPIIDPASIPSQSEPSPDEANKKVSAREEQIKEVHDIEAKISGLKKKLADQLDTMSEDEDFLNIRTEAEDLLNDFAEDVFQEISQAAPVATPPLDSRKSPISHTPAAITHTPKDLPKDLSKDLPKDNPKNISKELSKNLSKKTPKEPVDILPQIELNLPKRSVRERLGVRGTTKESAENKEKDKNKAKLPTSPERLTPERQPEVKPDQAVKKYSGGTPERPRRSSVSDESSVEKPEQNKRLISKVSVLEQRSARASCASVVRVRPRPRVCAPANNLLMKAVADAHKSLLNAPPKIEPQQRKLQRALVLPMRRIDNQKIVIQVPRDVQTDTNSDITTELENDGENKNKSSNNIVNREDKEIITPVHITKVINNTDYVPNKTASKRDDTCIKETKNKQKSNTKKHRNTQFIVTMDGFQPNTFLAKKLMMEGLLDEDDDLAKTALPKPAKSVLITKESEDTKEKESNESVLEDGNKEDEIMKQESPTAKENSKRKLSDSSEISKNEPSDVQMKALTDTSDKCDNQKKRLSDASEESYTQVIIKQEPQETGEKRMSLDVSLNDENSEKILTPPVKKRKASPIVFNIDKKEKEKETERARERTQSASSDGHVTITTLANSHKFDSIPPLSVAERKLVWCRAFPLCRYGSACAFAHPRCKFAAGCTRRGCVYAHCPPASPPAVASHVVPAANYKTISSVGAISICKYYPSCVNPSCHFYHPKPCRYGKACGNKLECNFYHNDAPAAKWKYA